MKKNLKLIRFLIAAPLVPAAWINAAEESGAEKSLKEEKESFASPCCEVKDGVNLFVTSDLLIWQATEDDLGYVIENQGSTKHLTHGKVVHPDNEWDAGFRVGIGYHLPHDKWDLYLNFTHFHGNANDQREAPEGGALFPIWQASFLSHGGYVTSSKAHWSINLNMGDLELGRNFHLGKWFSMRPFIGVKGGTVYDKYVITYVGGTAVSFGSDHIHMQNNFWGIGPRFGLNTLWGLGKGLAIYGDGAFSILAGNYSIHQKETLTHKAFKIKEHVNMSLSFAEMALGLQWNHLFEKDRYHLGVKLGWELNLLFDHNLFIKFLNPVNPGIFTQSQGDLSFQGLTFGMRFDF